MPNIPEPFHMRDWEQVTKDYDEFVFDLDATGDFLPLIWIDRSNNNFKKDTFGLPSYLKPKSMNDDGSQESINCAAAVLGATLVGINKSDQFGYDWVDMLENFYNIDNGEYLFLNRADTKTGRTFWYEIYPHVLLASLLHYYKDAENLDMIMKNTTDRWLEACVSLGGENIDFDFTGFDFSKMEPVDNGAWKEPEAAAGIAFILYMASPNTREKNRSYKYQKHLNFEL